MKYFLVILISVLVFSCVKDKAKSPHVYQNGVDDAVFVGTLTEKYEKWDNTSTVHRSSTVKSSSIFFYKKNDSVFFNMDTATVNKLKLYWSYIPFDYKYKTTGIYYIESGGPPTQIQLMFYEKDSFRFDFHYSNGGFIPYWSLDEKLIFRGCKK